MKTIGLIVLMHSLAIVDGNLTNRRYHAGFTELNPIVRPVQGSAWVYPVVNADVVMTDIMLIRHRNSRATKAMAVENIAGHSYGIASNWHDLSLHGTWSCSVATSKGGRDCSFHQNWKQINLDKYRLQSGMQSMAVSPLTISK